MSKEDCAIMFDKAKTSGLPLHIVSHNRKVQRMMDGLQIPWSAQWEIARGANEGRWNWEDVTYDKLTKLSNARDDAAYMVEEVLRPESFTRPPSSEIAMLYVLLVS